MTELRLGRPDDFLYIDSLRKIESEALGFIPAEWFIGILERRPILNQKYNRIHNPSRYNEIILTEDNGDRTGYCFFSFGKDIASIFQIVVQQDARRWHRALLLVQHVEAEAKKRHKLGVKARVAFDLESNLFWTAIGYSIMDRTKSTWLNQKESESKRPINIYFKPIATLLI